MKKSFALCLCLILLASCAPGPGQTPPPAAGSGGRTVVATTYPVYAIAAAVMEGAEGITLLPMLTEPVSCLHDYTLTTADMKLLESADLVLVSGAGLEPFLDSALAASAATVIDCSQGADLMDDDPHYWLDPANAAAMARTVGAALGRDAEDVAAALEAMGDAGREALQDLACRELITFHDGFAYLARALDLTVLRAIEEEDGATISARELTEIIALVQSRRLPAVFTEIYGTTSAAEVITRETGVPAYPLSTMLAPLNEGQTGLDGYRAVFEYNLSTLREALQ